MLFAGQLHTPFQNQKARHKAEHDGVVQRAVNSGMGFIVGDILAQRLTGEAFDAVRSLELGLYGTLLGRLVSVVLRVFSSLHAFKHLRSYRTLSSTLHLISVPVGKYSCCSCPCCSSSHLA